MHFVSFTKSLVPPLASAFPVFRFLSFPLDPSYRRSFAARVFPQGHPLTLRRPEGDPDGHNKRLASIKPPPLPPPAHLRSILRDLDGENFARGEMSKVLSRNCRRLAVSQREMSVPRRTRRTRRKYQSLLPPLHSARGREKGWKGRSENRSLTGSTPIFGH